MNVYLLFLKPGCNLCKTSVTQSSCSREVLSDVSLHDHAAEKFYQTLIKCRGNRHLLVLSFIIIILGNLGSVAQTPVIEHRLVQILGVENILHNRICFLERPCIVVSIIFT